MTKSRARRTDAGRSVALAGVRSLKIDVVQGPSDTISFQSLGVEPKLVVTLANRTRFDALAWGLALAVGLIGLAMTCRPAGTKTAFVFTVALLATLVPLVTESIEVAQLCNMVFYAATLLVPYYLAVGLVRWLVGTCCRVCARKSVVTPGVPATPAAILLAIVLVSGTYAGEPNERSQPTAAGPYVIQVVEPPAPVNVPEDAIILPYDPESTNMPQGRRQAPGALRQVRRAMEPGPPGQEDRDEGRPGALCPGRGVVQDAAWRATIICC